MVSGRLEYKYLFDQSELVALRQRLMPFLTCDPHVAGTSREEYTVHSIYLDTPNMRYYHEKHAGILHRRKLRIRAYNHPGMEAPVYLEIKEKYNQFIHKHRARVESEALNPLLENGQNAALTSDVQTKDSDGMCRFLFHLKAQRLRPSALVVYDREAYFGRSNNQLRITIDKSLRGKSFPAFADMYDSGDLKQVMPGRFILEVKFFGTLPDWLRQLISDFKKQRQALSKYTMTIDAQPVHVGWGSVYTSNILTGCN